MCYKDKTWCADAQCRKFHECPDALTCEVQTAAEAWWSPSPGEPPIAWDIERRSCFESAVNARSRGPTEENGLADVDEWIHPTVI